MESHLYVQYLENIIDNNEYLQEQSRHNPLPEILFQNYEEFVLRVYVFGLF